MCCLKYLDQNWSKPYFQNLQAMSLQQLQAPRRVLTSPWYFGEVFRIAGGLGTWMHALSFHCLNFPKDTYNEGTSWIIWTSLTLKNWISWRPQIVAKLPGTVFQWRNFLNHNPNAARLNQVQNVFVGPLLHKHHIHTLETPNCKNNPEGRIASFKIPQMFQNHVQPKM